ncbi:MAG: hypothetical protein IT377_11315 [Polyangiaceae bacterium]|nr:hypothetical protein [Polyangiaceae bacterium]
MAALRIASAFLVVSMVGITGCGGDDASGGGGSSGGGAGGAGGTTTGGTGGGAGSGGGPSCADGPGYPSSDAPHKVDEVNAKIVDVSGAPAEGVPVFICGTDVCAPPATTDAQGVVCQKDQTSGMCLAGTLPGVELKRPAFKYGDGTVYVEFAQLLATNTAKYDMGTATTAKLPDPSQGVALAAGAAATSSNVTVTLAAGAKIEIDEVLYDSPELQKFRAVEIPMAKAPAAVDKAAGFEILVGTTPIDTHFCPHATLSVPNTAGWPAGTEVEFWLHGVSVGQEWAPYGGWAKASGGKVSADGKSVVTSDGEGIAVLGVFGIKKK